MAQQFNGLKNVGGKKDSRHRATLSWLVNLVAADGAAANINVPGFGVISGWQFNLDPTSVQSSFTFGDGKALQLAINRFRSVLQDGTHFYISGRTFVYVGSTGQLFIFGGSPSIVVAAVGTFTDMPVDVENCIVPCEAIQPSIISVFFEADNLSGALVPVANMAPVSVNATLFNYEVPPLGRV